MCSYILNDESAGITEVIWTYCYRMPFNFGWLRVNSTSELDTNNKNSHKGLQRSKDVVNRSWHIFR